MSEPLRILLIIDLIGLALLGGFYLRTRRLTWWEWILCGLVMLVPLLGPFLIVAGQPGQSRKTQQPSTLKRTERLRARRTPNRL